MTERLALTFACGLLALLVALAVLDGVGEVVQAVVEAFTWGKP
jgi:hypothetical protein